MDDLPPIMDYNIRNGRTYMYFKGKPLFPFGYGLSYTSFEYSNLRKSSSRLHADGSITVSVNVKNTGARAGDEVVQMYIRDVVASVARPVKELKGFKRITLKPGEKQRVEYTLGPEHLGFYNRDMKFVVEPGEFKVMIGSSSEDVIEKSFVVVAR